jgi:hypothetical protein
MLKFALCTTSAFSICYDSSQNRARLPPSTIPFQRCLQPGLAIAMPNDYHPTALTRRPDPNESQKKPKEIPSESQS